LKDRTLGNFGGRKDETIRVVVAEVNGANTKEVYKLTGRKIRAFDWR
jgi:hypothetical protein